MYDATYTSYDMVDSAAVGAMAGFSIGYMLVCLIVGIFAIVCMWRIFAKAGKPGWASIIPVYNTIVMLQIAGMSPWMVLLMLVPVANVVVMILMYVNLAKAFGKSGGFVAGLILLNLIFMGILAFGDAEYQEV